MKEIFKIEGLSYFIKGNPILSDINLSLQTGEILALLGQNGAGKTTLIDHITQDIPAQEGSVSYPKYGSYSTLKKKLGIVYDTVALHPTLKVKEIFSLFGMFYGVNYLDRKDLIERLDITDIQEKLFKTLSKGEQKKVGLFIAFCHNPEIVILDEPTGELDPIITKVLWQEVFTTEGDRSIFFSTHRWEEAQKYADRIAFIKDGKISKKVLHKQDISQLLEGKRIVLSTGSIAMEELSKIANAKVAHSENTVSVYPELGMEKEVLSAVSGKTLNFSVQSLTLEDYYKNL